MRVWQLQKFLEACNGNDCIIVEEFKNWSYEKISRGAITVVSGESNDIVKRVSELDNDIE